MLFNAIHKNSQANKVISDPRSKPRISVYDFSFNFTQDCNINSKHFFYFKRC